MKKNELIKMFKDGNIVIPLYLLKRYKELKLKLEEFVFLIYLYNLGEKFLFNIDKMCNDLGLSQKEALSYINNLEDKGFIKVSTIKNEKGFMEEHIIMTDFYNKLSLLIMDSMEKNNSNESDIYELIQKEFGRTLGSIEIEIINAWLESNINEDLIKEALKEAVFNGVFNLKYIDKIIYEWEKAGVKSIEDVEKRRKNRSKKKDSNKDSEIDIDVVDWDWLDED